MELRRTTSHDPTFQSLTALLDAELRVRYGDVQSLYEGFNRFACDTVIVAEDAGCGCFKPGEGGAAELKRMFVRADRRQRGVASAVLAGLEAWARELGYPAMILETGNLQHEAIAMYARHGYARIDLFGPYVGLPASVCMRKSIC